ncbi:AraC family transcriptional regulator, partial [Acinetobacter calcoaceticus]
GRFFLLPEQQESTWDIRGGLKLVHLYYNDQHLRDVAEKIWDKEPHQIELNEVVFNDDEKILALYQFFLLDCDWKD